MDLHNVQQLSDAHNELKDQLEKSGALELESFFEHITTALQSLGDRVSALEEKSKTLAPTQGA